jgi:hypothetical protein
MTVLAARHSTSSRGTSLRLASQSFSPTISVAWRAALRVFELSYGKPAETVELDLDLVDPLHVAEMTSAERAQLAARVLEHHPHLAVLVPLHLRPVGAVPGGIPAQAGVVARDSQARAS